MIALIIPLHNAYWKQRSIGQCDHTRVATGTMQTARMGTAYEVASTKWGRAWTTLREHVVRRILVIIRVQPGGHRHRADRCSVRKFPGYSGR